MTPIVSVVIANYNYGRFLGSAIQSIVEQDCFNQCELIVVDGGSTDDSLDVIKRYVDKISWWVSEKDNGQSDAFNKGFAHARGDFGCWVNADDVLLPGTLKAVVDFIRRNHGHVDWIGGAVVWMNAEMKIMRCSMCQRIPFFLQRFMPAIIVGGPSSFFRLSVFRDLGGFDVRMHYTMDHDLWLRMFKRGVKLYMLKRYFWAFRLHEESKTAVNYVGPGAVRKRAAAGEVDSRILATRYPKTMRWWRRICKCLVVVKFIDGTYLRSWLDTRRFFGVEIGKFKQP